MRECLFCQIVRRKITCYKVYEDNSFLAFLDINPRVFAHTLVIPKKHHQWVYDVDNFKDYWQVVLIITKAMKKILNPYFITYATHGLEIPHAHIHVMPRQINETSFVPEIKNISKEKMEEISKKLYQQIITWQNNGSI